MYCQRCTDMMFFGIVLYAIMLCQRAYTKTTDCKWKVSFTNSLNITEAVSVREMPFSLIDITKTITKLSHICLRHSSEDTFFGYPYNILLEVLCPPGSEVDGAVVARNFVLQGDQPLLTLCWYLDQQSSDVTTCYMTKLAVIDLAIYKGRQGCQESICQPAWIAPLRHDNRSHVFTIEVHGIAKHIQSSMLIFNIHDYRWLSTAAVGLNYVVVSPDQFSDINFSLGYYFTKIWGPLQPRQSVYLSEDDFDTLKLLQLSEITKYSNATLCSCMLTSQYILKTAALRDRLIVLTQAGLFELHADYHSHEKANLILKSSLPGELCARDLAIPLQSRQWQQKMLLIGGCQNEGSVFTANVTTQQGTSLVFQNVGSSADEGPCHILKAATCRVVTCAITDLEQATVFCLLSIPHQYKLVKYAEFTWQETSSIPHRMEVPTYSDNMKPVGLKQGLKGSIQTITLHRISLSVEVTKHVYITGSHILHSSDGGVSFHLMPWDISGPVVLVAISRNEYMVFITKQHEIWATQIGFNKAAKIYPSLAWMVVHRRQDLQLPSNTLHIVSVFFDAHDALYLLLSDGSKIRKHHVPLNDIVQILRLQQMLSSSNLAAGLKTGCVSTDTSSVTEPWILYTRMKMYSVGPPQVRHKRRFHDMDSLLAYHALIENLERYKSRTYDALLSMEGKYQQNQSISIELWRDTLNKSQLYHSFLQNSGLLADMLIVDLGQFAKLLNMPGGKPFSAVIYLGFKQSYIFNVIFTLNDKAQATSLDEIILLSDSSEPDVVTIETEPEFKHSKMLKYQVAIRERGQLKTQNKPGIGLFHYFVTISLPSAKTKCFFSEGNNELIEGQYTLGVEVGCVPGQYVLFDWQAAWTDTELRDEEERPFDCRHPDPQRPCFYYSHTFYPYFTIYDDVTGNVARFEGNYTLKIIGGKVHEKDEIKLFTGEEVANYNRLDSTTCEKYGVWSPVDVAQPLHEGYPVYTNSNNAIKWICKSKSVCANIIPRFGKEPEYYFLVEFSNRHVDNNTYCDYTTTFLIHVHGLPINNKLVSMPLLVLCLILLTGHIAIYYFYHTTTLSRVLRLTLVKVHPASDNGSQTVIDTRK